MSKPEFVYTTYIETSAEKLWQALTDGDFTERYWFGHRVTSDWKAGSPYKFAMQGTPNIEGKVLVSDPPRRLCLLLGFLLAGGGARTHLSRHLRPGAARQDRQADRDA